MSTFGRLLLFLLSFYMLSACGGAAATMPPLTATVPPMTVVPISTETEPDATEEPIYTEPPVATEEPLPVPSDAPTGLPGPLTIEEQLARIDSLLKQSARASIAYNAPSEMELDETITIELLLNPSLSEEQLKEQVTEPGTVQSSGDVEITPQMKAELIPADPEAFTVTPLHDDPIQVVSGTETTKWSWYLTARKGGAQELSVVIYRLLKYEDREDWRVVETYKADIQINVSLLTQMKLLNWQWIAGPILALLAAAAVWRWYDQRKVVGRRKATAVVGHIFISYRRSDSADIVGRIYDRLVQEFGRESIFKDVDSIPLGVDFKGYLDKKVSECNVLLAVIGDRWLDATDALGQKRLKDPNDFVRLEIESALEQQLPVIPLLVRGAQMPEAEDLPAGLQGLAYRNGILIRPDPDFHRDMDRLTGALREYLREKPQA